MRSREQPKAFLHLFAFIIEFLGAFVGLGNAAKFRKCGFDSISLGMAVPLRDRDGAMSGNPS